MLRKNPLFPENADINKTVSISQWHKPQARVWTRIISILVSVTFVFPYLTWAFEPGSFLAPAHYILYNQQPIKIPPKFGAITQLYKGNERLVVHVQDLHCNYEVQNNIAKMIDLLAGQCGLQLVGIEGASLPINVTKLSTFPVEEVKRETAHYLMKQGKLTGPELYAATGKRPIWLEGIETAALYEHNHKTVRKFINHESQGYIFDLRETLEELKPGVYNPTLAALDKQKQAFRRGALSLLKYCAYLHAYANRCEEDLGAYPNLKAYLSKHRPASSEGMDADRLFSELGQLDQRLRARFYTTSVQEDMDVMQRRLDIMDKILNISASSEELAKYRYRPGDFKVGRFLEFISQHDKTGELILDPEVYALDRYLGEARTFYQTADERSRAFVENIIDRMEAHQTGISMLVTGGFHTGLVLKELESQGVSYICVKPQLRRRDIINPYFALLRNQRTPLEKLLAQNQNVLAIELSSPQRSGDTNRVIKPTELSITEGLYYRLADTILKTGLLARELKKFAEASGLLASYQEEIRKYASNDPGILLQQVKIKGSVMAARFNSGLSAFIHKTREFDLINQAAARFDMFGNKVQIIAADQEVKVLRKLEQTRRETAAQQNIIKAAVHGGSPVAALVLIGCALIMSPGRAWARVRGFTAWWDRWQDKAVLNSTRLLASVWSVLLTHSQTKIPARAKGFGSLGVLGALLIIGATLPYRPQNLNMVTVYDDEAMEGNDSNLAGDLKQVLLDSGNSEEESDKFIKGLELGLQNKKSFLCNEDKKALMRVVLFFYNQIKYRENIPLDAAAIQKELISADEIKSDAEEVKRLIEMTINYISVPLVERSMEYANTALDAEFLINLLRSEINKARANNGGLKKANALSLAWKIAHEFTRAVWENNEEVRAGIGFEIRDIEKKYNLEIEVILELLSLIEILNNQIGLNTKIEIKSDEEKIWLYIDYKMKTGRQPLNLPGAAGAWAVSFGVLAIAWAHPLLLGPAVWFFLFNTYKALWTFNAWQKMPNRGWTTPVAEYNPASGGITVTHDELKISTNWLVRAHEQYAHAWAHKLADRLMPMLGFKSVAEYARAAQAGEKTWGYYIWNVFFCEFLAHGLDFLAAPLTLTHAYLHSPFKAVGKKISNVFGFARIQGKGQLGPAAILVMFCIAALNPSAGKAAGIDIEEVKKAYTMSRDAVEIHAWLKKQKKQEWTPSEIASAMQSLPPEGARLALYVLKERTGYNAIDPGIEVKTVKGGFVFNVVKHNQDYEPFRLPEGVLDNEKIKEFNSKVEILIQSLEADNKIEEAVNGFIKAFEEYLKILLAPTEKEIAIVKTYAKYLLRHPQGRVIKTILSERDKKYYEAFMKLAGRFKSAESMSQPPKRRLRPPDEAALFNLLALRLSAPRIKELIKTKLGFGANEPILRPTPWPLKLLPQWHRTWMLIMTAGLAVLVGNPKVENNPEESITESDPLLADLAMRCFFKESALWSPYVSRTNMSNGYMAEFSVKELGRQNWLKAWILGHYREDVDTGQIRIFMPPYVQSVLRDGKPAGRNRLSRIKYALAYSLAKSMLNYQGDKRFRRELDGLKLEWPDKIIEQELSQETLPTTSLPKAMPYDEYLQKTNGKIVVTAAQISGFYTKTMQVIDGKETSPGREEIKRQLEMWISQHGEPGLDALLAILARANPGKDTELMVLQSLAQEAGREESAEIKDLVLKDVQAGIIKLLSQDTAKTISRQKQLMPNLKIQVMGIPETAKKAMLKDIQNRLHDNAWKKSHAKETADNLVMDLKALEMVLKEAPDSIAALSRVWVLEDEMNISRIAGLDEKPGLVVATLGNEGREEVNAVIAGVEMIEIADNVFVPKPVVTEVKTPDCHVGISSNIASGILPQDSLVYTCKTARALPPEISNRKPLWLTGLMLSLARNRLLPGSWRLGLLDKTIRWNPVQYAQSLVEINESLEDNLLVLEFKIQDLNRNTPLGHAFRRMVENPSPQNRAKFVAVLVRRNCQEHKRHSDMDEKIMDWLAFSAIIERMGWPAMKFAHPQLYHPTWQIEKLWKLKSKELRMPMTMLNAIGFKALLGMAMDDAEKCLFTVEQEAIRILHRRGLRKTFGGAA
jgi:hypothetical protein